MANETLSLNKAKTAGVTVSVASKLPMDFILHLHKKVTKQEHFPGVGTRSFDIYEKDNSVKPVVISGCSFPQNQGPHQQLSGGYAITHGVSKDFWDAWFEQNKEHEAIVNGMLFAHTEVASTIAETIEKKDVMSGMERLNPEKLPAGLKTADRKAA